MDHIISNLKQEEARIEQEIVTLQSKKTQVQNAMVALGEAVTTSGSPTTVIEVSYSKPETEGSSFKRVNYGITHALEYIFRVLLPEGKSVQYTVVYTMLKDKFKFTELTNEAFENILNYHASRGWLKKVKNGTQVAYACNQKRSWYEDTPRTVKVRSSVLSRMK